MIRYYLVYKRKYGMVPVYKFLINYTILCRVRIVRVLYRLTLQAAAL